MTQTAAKELLDLVMLDDYVERRTALDKWTKRWIASAVVIGRWEVGGDAAVRNQVVNVMRGEIFDALVDDKAKVMAWEFGLTEHGEPAARVTLHCVKAVPLEVE